MEKNRKFDISESDMFSYKEHRRTIETIIVRGRKEEYFQWKRDERKQNDVRIASIHRERTLNVKYSLERGIPRVGK